MKRKPYLRSRTECTTPGCTTLTTSRQCRRCGVAKTAAQNKVRVTNYKWLTDEQKLYYAILMRGRDLDKIPAEERRNLQDDAVSLAASLTPETAATFLADFAPRKFRGACRWDYDCYVSPTMAML